jgi:DNA-binding NarL/FixJ family response regulator
MDILRRQGESNQAIAKRLGITEGTVRYHLKRVFASIKEPCSRYFSLDA